MIDPQDALNVVVGMLALGLAVGIFAHLTDLRG